MEQNHIESFARQAAAEVLAATDYLVIVEMLDAVGTAYEVDDAAQIYDLVVSARVSI